MTSEQKLVEVIDANISIRQIFIDKYKINYALAGSGPPILLIHGANIGWGMWYPNIPKLAEHFTVYAIDLPGAGRSARVDYASLDPEKDLLHIVEKFVILLGLRKIDIIGCSIGGWLALQLAIRHSGSVNKIILENSVGFGDYMGLLDRVIGFYPLAKFITKTFLRPNDKNSKKFLRGIFHNRNLNLKEEFVEYFCETMKTSHSLLFISRLTALHRVFNLEKQLPYIKNETLIVWGEKDKIIPLYKNSNNFTLIPEVKIKIIKDTGHIPSLEKSETFNEIIINFLVGTS